MKKSSNTSSKIFSDNSVLLTNSECSHCDQQLICMCSELKGIHERELRKSKSLSYQAYGRPPSYMNALLLPKSENAISKYYNQSEYRDNQQQLKVWQSPLIKCATKRGDVYSNTENYKTPQFHHLPGIANAGNYDITDPASGGLLSPFFTKAYCFSNHFGCKIRIDGVNFKCTEQYYKAYKAIVFGDIEIAKEIMKETDPKIMKLLGSTTQGFDQDRWFVVSILVMVVAQVHKYMQNPVIRKKLFETFGTELVEASPTDIRWGVARGLEDELLLDRSSWNGLNLMGMILTKLRNRLMQFPQFRNECAEVFKKRNKF